MPTAARIIALVPMKGHSERVPNKNLRPFLGRPLYHHIMSSLLDCPQIAQVVVNTDSDAIARDLERAFPHRAVVRWRRPEIRGDFVSMNTIIADDISQVAGEHFLQTHSTNPLLKPETIARAIARYFEPGPHDSLVAVNRLQSRLYDAAGRPINHDPNEMRRTQDLPPVYEENSNLYLFSRRSFEATDRRIGRRPILFEVPKLESLDIDDEQDFTMAEGLARGLLMASGATSGVAAA